MRARATWLSPPPRWSHLVPINNRERPPACPPLSLQEGVQRGARAEEQGQRLPTSLPSHARPTCPPSGAGWGPKSSLPHFLPWVGLPQSFPRWVSQAGSGTGYAVAAGVGGHLLAMAPEGGPPASLRGKRRKEEGKGAAALKEDWWLSMARLSCCFSCDPPQACFPVAHCFIFILTVLAC